MYGKMQESGLTEIIPLIYMLYLNYLGPVSCFFLHPESPQGAQSGAAAVADGLMAATSSVY